MSAFASESSTARAAPVVLLDQLPMFAAQLAGRIRAGAFAPESVVYIETGARLFAHEVASLLGVPLAPLWVKRTGHGLKSALAPLVARLPIAARDWLRRVEERSGVHRVTRRAAHLPADIRLAGMRVLVIDDAADTGRTIAVARQLVIARGVLPENVRTAVLAATTPAAQAAVDFFVLDRNCRMPWSADSDERVVAARRAAALAPPHAPRDL